MISLSIYFNNKYKTLFIAIQAFHVNYDILQKRSTTLCLRLTIPAWIDF